MNLFNYFKNSFERFPQRPALVINGVQYSYDELFQKANQLAVLLNELPDKNIGIFAARALSDYSGILATLNCGKAYVALNAAFPPTRNQLIMKSAELNTLIINKKGIKQIEEMARKLPKNTVLIGPEIEESSIPAVLKHRFKVYTKAYFSKNKKQKTLLRTSSVSPKDIAYIIFTSGSTGLPKGVPVSHGNAISLIEYFKTQYAVGPNDRFSQFPELTFDASVRDIFHPWAIGASLYVIPRESLFAPTKFIKDNRLTIWDSAPSTIYILKKYKMLKSNIFPHLRYSFFGGEALSKTLALAWQKAAPNSIIENMYGPAEATIAVTRYALPKSPKRILTYHGVTSIGKVFKTQKFCLVNEENEKVEDYGELCLSGSQVFDGYWRNPEETKKHFFRFPRDKRWWFKTGDIVKNENGYLFFIDRKDFMVKVQGARVELEEINFRIKEITGAEKAFTLPYPITNGIANYLYTFMDQKGLADKKKIYKRLQAQLPAHMIPKEILVLEDFPVNHNGKIDRNQLIDKIKIREPL